MDTGSDPHPEGYSPDLSVATLVHGRNIHTAHKRGRIPVPKWLLHSFSGQGLVPVQGFECMSMSHK